MLNRELRSFFVDSVLFPAYHKIARTGVWTEVQSYRKTQWLGMDELEKLQHAKLKSLLKHCALRVPYYRDLFSSIGFDSDAAAEPHQWQKVPFLTKSTINKNSDKLRAENMPPSELIRNSTSGSTGETLRFFYDRRSSKTRQAAVWRDLEWASCKYSDRKAYLWGAPMDLTADRTFIRRFRAFLTGDINLSSYDLSDGSMNKYVKMLKKHKPKLLVSYPSPLDTFARFLDANHIRIPSIKAIITSAEKLYPWQRSHIENTFCCDVLDRYGCREFGHIAHECDRHEGYHVNIERFFLEVLGHDRKPVADGEDGDIVITDLDNYGFPMVRYQIGDIARHTKRLCTCGRGLPLIQSIEGRSFDIIVCPNGNRIAGTFWPILIKSIVPGTGVIRFQIEQPSIDKLILRIVKGEGYPKWAQEKLIEAIHKKCGHEIDIIFEYVKDIPLTVSGKIKFVISQLAKGSL